MKSRKSKKPGVTVKFGFEYRMKQGMAIRVLPREHTGHRKHPLRTTEEKTTHGHHHVMAITKIILILTITPKSD